MIWLLLAALVMAALTPLALSLRARRLAIGAQGIAIALHRAQLGELDRDLSEARILPAEHATAVLEIQRRLLATATRKDAILHPGSRLPILVVMGLVPAAALVLYALGGHPNLPSVSGDIQEAALILQLRDQLAVMDPTTDRARQGYILLGNVEEAHGDDAEAATAWRRALQIQFDPTLAARTGAAELRAKGTIDASTADLFRRALAEAPDAPWREAVQERLNKAGMP